MGNECSCLPKNLNNSCFNGGGSSSETYSGETNEVHRSARVHVRQVNPPVSHENSSANLSQSKSSMNLDNSRANKSIIENANRPATYKQLTDEEAAHYSWQKDMLASFMVDTLRPLDVSQVALKWYQCTRTKEVYRGEMSNGKKEGSGEIYWPDGSAYRGCWKNDARDGPGIYLDVDKIVYIGEWKNNKKHGKGTEILPNGVKREVLWNDGRRII